MATFPSRNFSRKRCKKCKHLVDCMFDEVCFLDVKRLKRLNSILAGVASQWRDMVFYTRPRTLTVKEIISYHKFDLQFTGSRNERRGQARAFITRHGSKVISDWEFGRSNGKPVFRLRY